MKTVQNVSFDCMQESIDAYQSSPARAIEKIMDDYGDGVKRLVYTYVKNEADTDDVTQEVFLTIYQKLDSYKGESSFKSWLYAIAINESKDHLRSWKYRSERLIEKLKETSHTWGAYHERENPLNHILKQSESEELFSELMNLSLKYREVLILYYFKELSTKEIAYALNLKEATIRTRLSRGREKLKSIVQGGKTNG